MTDSCAITANKFQEDACHDPPNAWHCHPSSTECLKIHIKEIACRYSKIQDTVHNDI